VAAEAVLVVVAAVAAAAVYIYIYVFLYKNRYDTHIYIYTYNVDIRYIGLTRLPTLRMAVSQHKTGVRHNGSAGVAGDGCGRVYIYRCMYMYKLI